MSGGKDLDAGAKVQVPGGSGEVTYSSKSPTERRNDYLTCMNDRQAQCGALQSAQSCQDMAARACMGLIGSPSNPQKRE